MPLAFRTVTAGVCRTPEDDWDAVAALPSEAVSRKSVGTLKVRVARPASPDFGKTITAKGSIRYSMAPRSATYLSTSDIGVSLRSRDSRVVDGGQPDLRITFTQRQAASFSVWS